MYYSENKVPVIPRIAQEIDYAVSATLEAAELGAMLNAAAGSTYSVAELESVIAHSTAYVTARDGERLVGFGRLLSDGAIIAYLNNLAVHPDYQGRGIGKAVLATLIETAGNVRSIFLYTDTADALYLRAGFQRSEKRLYVLKPNRHPEVTKLTGSTSP